MKGQCGKKGKNLYVWNLTKETLHLSPYYKRLLPPYTHEENYDRLFTDKKHRVVQLIGTLVIGCLYYSINDLVSQKKNVIFAISSNDKKCKELIDLVFMNPKMIKKLLHCAITIPNCNMIDWYEKSNNILIMSKPNFVDHSKNQNIDITLLKLSINGDV